MSGLPQGPTRLAADSSSEMPESGFVRFVDRFVHEDVHRQGPEARRRARALIVVASVGIVANALAPVIQANRGLEFQLGCGATAVGFGISLLLVRSTRHPEIAANIYLFAIYSFLMFINIYSHGSTAELFSLSVVPLLAMLLVDVRSSVFWSALTLLALAGLGLAPLYGLTPSPPPVAEGRFQSAFALGLVTTAFAMLAEVLRRRASEETRRVERQAAATERQLTESEDRFRAIVDHAAGIITEWHTEGLILYISPQVKAITGLSPSRFLEYGWRRLVASVDSSQLAAFDSFRDWGADIGRTAESSFQFRRKNGELRLFHVAARSFLDAQGEVRVVSVTRDATDDDELKSLRSLTTHLESVVGSLRSNERELRASEERYRVVVEAASDAIITIDENNRIVLANSSVERIFGYPAEELIGEPVQMLIPRELRSAHSTSLMRYLETGRPTFDWRSVERPGRHRSGRMIPLGISFGEHVDGERHLFTAVVRDDTERKLYADALEDAAAELSQRNEDLARLNRDLEEFTSIASHDLQEPVRKLTMFSELLEKDASGDLSEDARRDLQFIGDAARRMGSYVRDLLELSRAGSLDMNLAPVSVSECVDRALENLEIICAESGARVTRGPLPRINADSLLTIAIYQNLIHNAIKFRGDDPPEVDLSAEYTAEGWVLAVTDNGIGLEPGVAGEIFKPFRRLHPVQRYKGSGIGLAFCRKAVERHGGRIWVESTPGRGSSFKFTLGSAVNESSDTDAQEESRERAET